MVAGEVIVPVEMVNGTVNPDIDDTEVTNDGRLNVAVPESENVPEPYTVKLDGLN
jgi:hypothetical protein